MLKHILVFTHSDDLHAHAVCERIRRIAPAAIVPTLIDIGTFPAASRIALTPGSGSRGFLEVSQPLPGNYSPIVNYSHRDNGFTRIPLEAVQSIWWRRPRLPVPDARIENLSVRRFVERNTRDALHAAVSTLCDRVLCVNEPHLDDRANMKGYQLAVAEQVGLNVPPTLITNDPQSIQDFVAEEGLADNEVVYKPVAIIKEAQQSTQLFDSVAHASLDKSAYCPTIFQRRIVGSDVRVVIIGDYIFALEQVPSGRDCVDVRMDGRAVYAPYDLAPSDSALVQAMMRRLGLSFAACDFRKDQEGRLWFLEVNPGGQWLWLETNGGCQVSEAFARVLVEGRHTTGPLLDAPFSQADLQRIMPFEQTTVAYKHALAADRAQRQELDTQLAIERVDDSEK